MQTPSCRKVRGRKKESGKKERRRKNNAKYSGHYVCPRTHNMRAHVLRSHQFNSTQLGPEGVPDFRKQIKFHISKRVG